MAINLEIYKCAICGNIIEVLHAGPGELVCCGEAMQLQTENTVDASREKHVPVIEKGNGTVTVKIGSVPHPMEEKHYIEWIEIIADGKVYRQVLKPGDAPEATFPLSAGTITATIDACLELGRIAKQESPGATYILGGVHPTFMWKDVLEAPGSPVDFVVVGEGEQTTEALLVVFAPRDVDRARIERVLDATSSRMTEFTGCREVARSIE